MRYSPNIMSMVFIAYFADDNLYYNQMKYLLYFILVFNVRNDNKHMLYFFNPQIHDW